MFSVPAPARSFFHRVQTAALSLARPDVVFYSLIWLMVILVLGTVAQKYVGLYLAQQKIFYAWVIWAGPVPVPGGMPAMVVLTLGLLAKIIFKSVWSAGQSGIIITHIGALLLMLGGFLTYVQSREGNIVLFPGERSGYVTDYHNREMVIEQVDDAGVTKTLSHRQFDHIRVGDRFTIPNTETNVEVVKACRNCRFIPRGENDPAASEFRGRAKNFDIVPADPAINDEENVAAAQFRISGTGTDKDGIHFSTEMIDVAPTIEVGGKTFRIAVRRERRALPFEIELVSFVKTVHPGTEIARSYHSEVVVHERDQKWQGIIRMNEPLRYRGYTLYQASHLQADGKSGSVFAVVENAGRMFPYISSIIMCIGLLIHLVIQMPKLIRRRLTLMVACLLIPHMAQAGTITDADLDDFRRIPILHEGRVKPMDTFARSLLEQFSARDRLDGLSADRWLLEAIMTPDVAFERPLFRVTNRTTQQMLGLPPVAGSRYSYHQVTAAFREHTDLWQPLIEQDEKALDAPHAQMIELLQRVDLFTQLAQSLTAITPDFVIDDKKMAASFGTTPGASLSYLDMLGHQESLRTMADKLATRVERDENITLSPTDQMVMGIAGRMKFLDQNSQNTLFRVIHPTWQKTGEEWVSPWAVIGEGKGGPDTRALLSGWRELIISYRSGDAAKFRPAAHALYQAGSAHESVKVRDINLEVSFNQIAPFKISFYAYMAGLVGLAFGFLFAPRFFYVLAISTIACGLAVHIGGIGVRMIIMERPPVTNLYSSVLFVGLVGVVIGLGLEYALRNRLGVLCAAISGTFLQLVGLRFDAEGDQMGMLVAVLDTNFWLATHVVVITFGYAAAIVGGVLGHVYLIVRLADRHDMARATALFKNMHGVVLLGILLTAIGTILGGIWADQSWGRFWGWDPKENGALLIVLWLVWIVHGRLSGHMGMDGYSSGLSLSLVVVASAWFGVNLLGVGLHSYGFTESAQIGYILFCTIDILIVLCAYAVIRWRSADKKIGSAA